MQQSLSSIGRSLAARRPAAPTAQAPLSTSGQPALPLGKRQPLSPRLALHSQAACHLSQPPHRAEVASSLWPCSSTADIPMLLAATAPAATGRTSQADAGSTSTSSPAQDLLLLDTKDAVLQSIYCRMSGSTCTAPSRNDQDQEFYINFGRAVRTLREDIALFFHKPADMSIFTEDIGFIDNISSRIGIAAPIRVTGKEAYRRHLWSLRFHAGIIFSRSEVNILRLWQRTPQSVSVRWTIRCYPRLLNGVVGSVVYLDGVSEYKFNSKGLIYEHSVDILNWDGLRMGLKKRGQQVALVPTPF